MTTKKTFLFLLFVLITLSLACSLPAILQQGNDASGGIPDGLTENYAPSLGYTPTNPFNYSPEQMTVINKHGNPTRFTIIFTDIDRQETWYYDTLGYTVVFRNGVKFAERNETPQYQEGMYATMLGPNQFYRGMSMDEVVLSTGRNDINLVTLEGLEKESRLMYLAGLSVGLVNGRVNFVETIPAMSETMLRPEDFVPLVTLTPEELANEGTHLYQSMLRYGGREYTNDPITIKFTFENGSVFLGDGQTNDVIIFSPIGNNQYQNFDEIMDGQLIMTFNLTGFTWQFTQEGEVGVTTFTLDTGTSQAPSDPAPTAEPAPGYHPTPEEAAIQGTNTYSQIFYMDGELLSAGGHQVFQLSFEEDGMHYLPEDGEEQLYAREDENKYQHSWDGGHRSVTITPTGFYWIDDIDETNIENYYVRFPTDPSQKTPADGITPEEALNLGEHTYNLLVFVDRYNTGEYQAKYTFSFDDGGLQMADSLTTINYTKIGPNRYLSESDDPEYVVFTNKGFIWQPVDISDTSLEVFHLAP